MKSRPSQALFALASLVALVPIACSSAGGGAGDGALQKDASGTVGLALTLAPGVTLSSVNYNMMGPQNFAKSGTINIANSTTISATFGGLPPGDGFSITLTSTTGDGGTTCQGSATFNVKANQTTAVTVRLTCQEQPTTGSAHVDGTLNVCPLIDGVEATPAEVNVGATIALSLQAHDTDHGPMPLQYQWSAPKGTFSNASGQTTGFTCTDVGDVTVTVTASDGDPASGCLASSTVKVSCTPGPLQNDVQNIVVIYAENRSFDGLFGNFPGAHGLSEVVDPTTGLPTAAYIPQKNRDGTTVLPKLPQTWGGATASGNPTVIPQAATDNLPNAPFPLETGFVAVGGPTAALTSTDVTRDMAHRFFENLMEINGGTNDMFAAWLDAGGITMGHFDYSHSALFNLAKQNVIADNFFQAAYGGSFLNHQYLICACAPTVPASFLTTNSPSLNTLNGTNSKGVWQLATNATSPASALDGAPSLKTGNIVGPDYTGDGYWAVNTMQPPYQPSGNAPAADTRYAVTTAATTLPVQSQQTIGDLLTAKSVTWAWYATSWDAAVADGALPTSSRTVIYQPAVNGVTVPRGAPDFQAHHHPFNYYGNFDPATHAADRAAHLKDYTALVSDITAGTLPAVTFYKPTGNVNQHPGYANIDDADAHIADLVNKLKAGPQWQKMVIVITYDEYGGQWDHVAPPKGDKIGPGTRIPAIIVSPFAKAGTVDHTQYDTASILRLITHRYLVATLPGLATRDAALVTNGGVPMGDLTNALNLP